MSSSQHQEQKTFFLVRHGESTWNKAKSQGNLWRLLMYRDHSLSSKGVKQAADLNTRWKSELESRNIDQSEVTNNNPDGVRREKYVQLFTNADKVYCSPFTRTIQTALVSLKDHTALNNELTLLSSLREVKVVGCFDATGKKCGNEIVPRVHRKLTQELDRQQADALVETVKFDVNDVVHEWWPPMWSGTEKKEDTQTRVREFLSFIRGCDAKTPIIVGHSWVFKAFYSERISKVLAENQPELSANMQRFRLGNSTVLAVTVSFVGDEVEIVDADVLFEGNDPNWVR